MNKIKNSSMFLLWAGAAISLSEIFTGGLIAPLGLTKGILAIVIGHVIGTAFLALGGYISFQKGKNAMESVRSSMGGFGTKIIAFLNVLQLVGWSAVMIIQGGRALHFIFPGMPEKAAVLVMAVIVLVWAYYFNNYSKRVNDLSVVLLILLCTLLFWKFDFRLPMAGQGSISFATAIELSIAMPISWLPLIGDYTRNAANKSGAYKFTFLGYFIGSVLMYVLGLLISINTGKDIIEFIATSYVKWLACIVVVLSTATTTFLDIYSAVVSSKQFLSIKKENLYILGCSVLATGVAFVFPIESYESFLLMIGSIFVPVYTVIFMDYLMKREKQDDRTNFAGIAVAFAGTILYQWLSKTGIGIPTVIVVAAVSVVYFTTIKLFNFGGASYAKQNL